MQQQTIREAALFYASRGAPVFPCYGWINGACSCGNCKGSPAKHPLSELVPHGLLNASTDESTVNYWFDQRPDANIAIVTGIASGFVVLDVDPRHGGVEAVMELEQRYGPLPKTVRVKTGGGGDHFFFRHPGPGFKAKNSEGEIGPGLDIRGDGGYVLAVPSTHESGGSYQWAPGCAPGEVALAPLPDWLKAMVLGNQRRDVPAAVTEGEEIPEGKRHDTFVRMAGALRRQGATPSEITDFLLLVNRTRCHPPEDEREVRRYASASEGWTPVAATGLQAIPSTASQKPSFGLISYTTLLKKEPPQYRWLVEDLLKAYGTSLLGASPKTGKSSLLRTLIYLLMTGEAQWIGRDIGIRGPVLYLALEEDEYEVRLHFQAMGMPDEMDNLYISIGSAPEDAYGELQKIVREIKPILVVIDPLQRLLRLSSINDYSEVTKAMEWLGELARTEETHIMAVLHDKKMSETWDITSIAGSIGFVGSVDTIIQMRSIEGFRVVKSTHRYGRPIPETALVMDPITRRVLDTGTIEEAQLASCAGAIPEVLGFEEITEKELCERLRQFDRATVSKALRGMVEIEAIERQGNGRPNQPFTYRKPRLAVPEAYTQAFTEEDDDREAYEL